MSVTRLHVDWTACDGRGLCAELLPELLVEDDWGYPVARTGEPEPAVSGSWKRPPGGPSTVAPRWRYDSSSAERTSPAHPLIDHDERVG